jgi:type VI secretion system protein VasD
MVAVACVLVGCSVADGVVSKVIDIAMKPDPTIVEVTVDAAPDVNPDPFGRASPIWIRVFVLASAGVFEHQPYSTLRRQGDELLGPDIKDSDEKSLLPGESTLMVLTVKPEDPPKDKYYVSVMAAYRDLERAVWRTSMAIPTEEKTSVQVRLDRLAVSVGRVD